MKAKKRRICKRKNDHHHLQRLVSVQRHPCHRPAKPPTWATLKILGILLSGTATSLNYVAD